MTQIISGIISQIIISGCTVEERLSFVSGVQKMVRIFMKRSCHQVHSGLCNFKVALLQHTQLGTAF